MKRAHKRMNWGGSLQNEIAATRGWCGTAEADGRGIKCMADAEQKGGIRYLEGGWRAGRSSEVERGKGHAKHVHSTAQRGMGGRD